MYSRSKIMKIPEVAHIMRDKVKTRVLSWDFIVDSIIKRTMRSKTIAMIRPVVRFLIM